MRRWRVFCPATGGRPLPQGACPAGCTPPLSSSQSPLSSVSLAVTSSVSLVPAMLARTRSLRCSGSPHRAGRGGGPIFGLAKRETGRTRKGYAASVSGRAANGYAIARSKEKKRFGRNFAHACKVAVRRSADRCLLRFGLVFGHAMVFCDSCDCRPAADSIEVIGEVVALTSSSFRCRSPLRKRHRKQSHTNPYVSVPTLHSVPS